MTESTMIELKPADEEAPGEDLDEYHRQQRGSLIADVRIRAEAERHQIGSAS